MLLKNAVGIGTQFTNKLTKQNVVTGYRSNILVFNCIYNQGNKLSGQMRKTALLFDTTSN